MEENAVMRSQGYAVSLELRFRNIFSCDSCGVGGLVNASYIRKYPYHAMVQALTYIYANACEEKRNDIEKFIEKFYDYSVFRIDDLLSFETKENKISDIETFVLEKNNGIEQLEYIINEFEQLAK